MGSWWPEEFSGTPSLALTISAGGLAVAAVVSLYWKLPAANAPDLTPSRHWPAPIVAGEEFEADVAYWSNHGCRDRVSGRPVQAG